LNKVLDLIYCYQDHSDDDQDTEETVNNRWTCNNSVSNNASKRLGGTHKNCKVGDQSAGVLAKADHKENSCYRQGDKYNHKNVASGHCH